MLKKARDGAPAGVSFVRAAGEQAESPAGSFNVVVSSLMFHYVEDLPALFRKVRNWLAEGGTLALSMEHPVSTAAQGRESGQWETDNHGREVAWRVDNYTSEGKRISTWFGEGVVRYHRTLATILNGLNGLVDAGFRITRVLEPGPPDELVRADPEFLDERRQPTFRYVAAQAI